MRYQLPRPGMLTWKSAEERRRAERFSRLLLTFLKEAGSGQLRQLPVVGPLLAAGLEVVQRLSDEAADREAGALLERVAVGQQGTAAGIGQFQQDLAVLTTLSVASFSLQRELAEWMTTRREPPVEATALSEFGVQAALVAHWKCGGPCGGGRPGAVARGR